MSVVNETLIFVADFRNILKYEIRHFERVWGSGCTLASVHILITFRLRNSSYLDYRISFRPLFVLCDRFVVLLFTKVRDINFFVWYSRNFPNV